MKKYRIGKITTHDGADKVDPASKNRLGRIGTVEICGSKLFDCEYMLFWANRELGKPAYSGFTTSRIIGKTEGENMMVIVTENTVYVLYEVNEDVA